MKEIARKEGKAMKYTDHFKTHNRRGQDVRPTQKIPGTNQKRNNGGGFSFVVDKWTQLNRFLILGSEGGSYYASEKKLTVQNAKNVLACIREDGRRAVDEIVAVSQAGRAVKNDPAVFALALAASHGDAETRKYAFEQLQKVCRIGTHLFGFAEAIRSSRGWSKAVSRAFRKWYEQRSTRSLAKQLTKYQSRNGWSHRDILRLSHIKTDDEDKAALYRWAIKGEHDLNLEVAPKNGLEQLWAFERVKRASSESEVIKLVQDHKLPWECVPTDKRTAGVWEAMLPHMGLGALIRNLGSLTAKDVIGRGRWKNNQIVAERLTDAEALKAQRVHPLSVLVALKIYGQGRGMRGKLCWSPVSDIKDVLDETFHLSFDAVEPANKRFLLGLDVSGSMGWATIAGMPITPKIGAAAMAMITRRTEPYSLTMGFSHRLQEVNLGRKDTLETVIRKLERIPMGATNIALPMEYALQKKIEVDAFVVYTDNEVNCGVRHPAQALQRYRDGMGIPARLIVVGMTATNFSVADPRDAGSLDIAGFDTAAPGVIRNFAAGEF
jgi:60 kDa SS-A/Ro ribonucleoprotein